MFARSLAPEASRECSDARCTDASPALTFLGRL